MPNPVRLLLGNSILNAAQTPVQVTFQKCKDGSGLHELHIVLSLMEQNPLEDPATTATKGAYRDAPYLDCSTLLSNFNVSLQKTDVTDTQAGATLTISTQVGLKVPGTADGANGPN